MLFHRQPQTVAEPARSHYPVRILVAFVIALTTAATACSGSEPAQPVEDPDAVPTAASVDPAIAPAGSAPPSEPTPPLFSNVVPSVDELLEIGLTRDEAECFIEQLDPDGTGVFTDADRFGVALGVCFGSVG